MYTTCGDHFYWPQAQITTHRPVVFVADATAWPCGWAINISWLLINYRLMNNWSIIDFCENDSITWILIGRGFITLTNREKLRDYDGSLSYLAVLRRAHIKCGIWTTPNEPNFLKALKPHLHNFKPLYNCVYVCLCTHLLIRLTPLPFELEGEGTLFWVKRQAS